uniref:Uncharacterized protein n=1 Tax=Hucho hucho TaxID=62062 RepID=A0A4W5PJW2_9TELE
MPHSMLQLCISGLLCYIQNCPRDRKHALFSESSFHIHNGFGPSICCGEGLGFPETARCMEGNYQVGGRPCGSEVGRSAAAPGVCCDSGTVGVNVYFCYMFIYISNPYHYMSKVTGELLMHLLHFATRGQSEY